MINANDILGFSEQEIKEITVPQWKHKKGGGVTYLRSLDHGEITTFRSICNTGAMAQVFGLGDNTAMQQAKDMLLIQSLSDSKGVRLFNDDDLEKVRAIQGETEAFEFIFEQAIQFNKILKKDQDDLDKPVTDNDDMEDLKKKLTT